LLGFVSVILGCLVLLAGFVFAILARSYMKAGAVIEELGFVFVSLLAPIELLGFGFRDFARGRCRRLDSFPASKSKLLGQVDLEYSRIEQSLMEGKLAQALEAIQYGLNRARAKDRPEDAAPLPVLMARLHVEAGQVQPVAELLEGAIRSARESQTGYWRAAVLRERAGYLMLLGDYAGAGEAAKRAYKESNGWGSASIRVSYCRALEALAMAKLGQGERALRLLEQKPFEGDSKKARGEPFFAPRVHFLVAQAYAEVGHTSKALEHSRVGMQLARNSGLQTRTLSLAHLAAAEANLAAGDTAESRRKNLEALRVTYALFGKKHQDAARGLALLAQVEGKEGKVEAARGRAEEALATAREVLGVDAPALREFAKLRGE
jgi:tetratricopeptide (TPR) repeat protein